MLLGRSFICPDSGCTLTNIGQLVDMRSGILYWSNLTTWANYSFDYNNTLGKPMAGYNLTIPYGWNLVIDESPQPQDILTIQGNVTFDPTVNITLQANNIIIVNTGVMFLGNATSPFTGNAVITMNGGWQ